MDTASKNKQPRLLALHLSLWSPRWSSFPITASKDWRPVVPWFALINNAAVRSVPRRDCWNFKGRVQWNCPLAIARLALSVALLPPHSLRHVPKSLSLWRVKNGNLFYFAFYKRVRLSSWHRSRTDLFLCVVLPVPPTVFFIFGLSRSKCSLQLRKPAPCLWYLCKYFFQFSVCLLTSVFLLRRSFTLFRIKLIFPCMVYGIGIVLFYSAITKELHLCFLLMLSWFCFYI